MKKIVIVDENKYWRDGLSNQLRATLRNCLVMTAEDDRSAMKILENGPVDLLLACLRMPEMNGHMLMECAKRCDPPVPIYVLTSDACPADEQSARSLGVRHFILKPISFEKIARFISHELNVIKQSHTDDQIMVSPCGV